MAMSVDASIRTVCVKAVIPLSEDYQDPTLVHLHILAFPSVACRDAADLLGSMALNLPWTYLQLLHLARPATQPYLP